MKKHQIWQWSRGKVVSREAERHPDARAKALALKKDKSLKRLEVLEYLEYSLR
jgi:hypothetical protein